RICELHALEALGEAGSEPRKSLEQGFIQAIAVCVLAFDIPECLGKDVETGEGGRRIEIEPGLLTKEFGCRFAQAWGAEVHEDRIAIRLMAHIANIVHAI